MNFHLTSGEKNVERRPHICACSYCKRVFDDPRALGGYQRAHREDTRSRKSWYVPGRSGNPLNMTGPTPNSHMTTQFKHFPGGFGNNQGAVFGKAPPSLIFPKRLPTNNNGWANVGQFSVNSVGNTKTPFCAAPNFPSGGGRAEIHQLNTFSGTASAPTYCTNPSAIPANPSLLMGPGNVCQFNTNQSRYFMGGGQFSGNALPQLQYPNQGMYAVAVPGPLLGSNQQPAFREPTNKASSFPYQNHLSGGGGFGEYNENHFLTHQGGKKRCFGEATHVMSVPKMPKIDSNLTMETVEHGKKELLLFKDTEKSSSDLEISVDANEEPETDLDLSLHL